MKQTPKHYPTEADIRAGMRRCRNISCGSFIEYQQEGFQIGYCTEWCKEMNIALLRKGYKRRSVTEILLSRQFEFQDKEIIDLKTVVKKEDIYIPDYEIEYPHKTLPLILII
jgi:hypothetical protein